MNQPYRPKYPLLCAPMRVGNVTLRSRMCSAPMGFPDLTEDGCLTEGAIAFYENRARGGAAIVTVSEACVDYENGMFKVKGLKVYEGEGYETSPLANVDEYDINALMIEGSAG